MQSLKEAIKVLRNNIKDAKPDAYWIKDSTYIFRLRVKGRLFGCNIVIVEGDKVKGIHPLNIDVDMKDMIKIFYLF